MSTLAKHATSVTPISLPLNLRFIIMLLVFIAIFAGFQGGRYYFANRLQELGIAASLGLYLLGAWRGLFMLPAADWYRWVMAPALLIVGIMVVSALVFNINYAGNPVYSFFSAREFLLGFLGPGIYLLCRCGMATRDVHSVVWVALVALMLNYLFFYATMDLREVFFSSDHTKSNLVTYDEWRGFRLKPPLFAIMVALLAGLALIAQARSKVSVLGAILVIALGGYIWSIVLYRATLATMALSVILYPIFLASRSRVQLILVAAPLALLAAPVMGHLALNYFLSADGGTIRAKAFASALELILRHPLLGAGEDSAYGLSYQDIVAFYFYPSDLGLVGTGYKYGLIGVSLYLFMHCKIWLALWRANIFHREREGAIQPLIWAMLMFMTAQTFNLMLNPGLAYAQGITLGSLALALASLEVVHRPLTIGLDERSSIVGSAVNERPLGSNLS
ncbi:hypothetical protein A3709_09045 [Halioglobus sp. HI00S01]|uniref:hypothetical protein n=1 Tax=Halioglobus sp. HI00S01 TaxID=1822214 RepID=UPI0007C39D64|nr:hypothetical protein [Halioglobus sp. HI00S01]KZX55124.1 hypothetical protein A3709_09045 [Halioglobus sp. HI00S01]